MILIVDNYDSFTWNLAHRLGELGAEVEVRRNDAVSIGEIDALGPTHLVVSPGPGRPEQAGISVDAIRHCAGKLPVLGVCLGHQALATAFGGSVERARVLMHGKVSRVRHDGRGVFAGLGGAFEILLDSLDSRETEILAVRTLALNKALSLNDELGEAYASLGLLKENNYEFQSNEASGKFVISLNYRFGHKTKN